MTINDLRNSNCVWITPAEAASILHCDPHSIRVQAHTAPDKLGYPVIVIGRRVRIPRKPFIAYVDGGDIWCPALQE